MATQVYNGGTIEIKAKSDGIKETSKALDNLASSSDYAEKSIKKLINSLDGSIKQYMQAQAAAQMYATTVKNSGIGYDVVNKSITSLDQSVQKLSKTITTSSETLDRLQKIETSTANATEKMGTVFKEAVNKFNVNGIIAALTRLEEKSAETASAIVGMGSTIIRTSAEQVAAINSIGNASLMTATKSKEANSIMRLQSSIFNDLHASSRGLAGSLGALWVTYSQMVPLAAGLAFGAALKGIITDGVEVQHILEGIRVKGDETYESINQMRDSLLSLGKGIYAPKEVAQAFETLILAGQKSEQALSSINSALNLATIGGTSIEKSAYTIVQVTTAMGMQAEASDRVADVISKSAAVSMSSVDSLSEAFKQGSSVNKLYGVSLVDVGTSLAALSNLGIQGSAAGTSLKNAYKELASNSDKVKNALATLKLTPESFKDDKGNFLDLVTVIGKLDKGLRGLKEGEAKKAMADLANERGMKTIVEVLDMFRQKTEEGGSQLEKFRDQIENSFGYAAVGAAQMAITTENQFKGLKNTIQGTFIESFKALEPTLNLVINNLQQVFGSDSTKRGIVEIINYVISLTQTLVENTKIIGMAVAAWYAFKTAVSIAVTLQEVVMSIKAVSAASIALKEAQAAAALQSAIFAETSAASAAVVEASSLRVAASVKAVQAAFGLLGIALAAAALAYSYFNTEQTKANNEMEAHEKQMSLLNSNLDQQIEKLTSVNKLLREGKTEREAEADAAMKQALAKQGIERAANLAPYGQKLDEAQREFDKLKAREGAYYAGRSREAQALKLAQDNYNAALKRSNDAYNETIEKQQKIINLSKENFEITEKRRKAEQDSTSKTFGAGKYEVPDTSAADKAARFTQNEILDLTRSIATFKEKTRVMNEYFATGKKLAEESQVAVVNVNKALNQYNGSETLYKQALVVAEKADAAKAEYDSTKQLFDVLVKINGVNQAEAEYAKQQADGSLKTMGNFERQLVAMRQLQGESSKITDEMIKQARLADQTNVNMETHKRLEKLTNDSNDTATRYKREAEEIEKFGLSAKATALEVAKLEALKNKLTGTGSELIVQQRLEAAAMEDLSKAYLNVTKKVEELKLKEQERAAYGSGAVIGSETAKVEATRLASEKMIQYNEEMSRKAIEAITDPELKARAEENFKGIKAKLDELRNMEAIQIKIDFEIAKNKDLSTIFGEVSNISSKLGDGFKAATTAMQNFSSAFTNMAKAQEAERNKAGSGLKYQVGAYGDMANAAKGFFAEGSKGYRTLDGVAKIAHISQMAMILAENGAKAVGAVLTQANGDPYTAWGRMAAMAAVVAGLGYAVGGGFSGGGDDGRNSAAYVQKMQGTGTVFGDSNAKSDSIKRSIDAMKATEDKLLPINQGMLDSLQAIQSGIEGLANLVVRNGNITTGANFNVAEGTISRGNSFTQMLSGIPIIGKLASLWGKTTQTVTDAGIALAGSIQDLISGKGLANYVNVLTESSSWFGLSKSSSNSMLMQGLDSTIAKQIGNIFRNMQKSLQEAGKALYGSSTFVDDALSKLTIEFTKVSLKGLSGQALSDAINNVISSVLDKMAAAAFSGFDKYAKVGEGMAETVIRVANTFSVMNATMQKLGLNMYLMNGAGIDAAMHLAELVGGIENFQSMTSSYFDKYYTESERNAKIQSMLTEQFNKQNLALPTTRDRYRRMVEEASRLGNAEQLAFLLKYADAFAGITSATQDGIKALTDAFKTIGEYADKMLTGSNSPLGMMEQFIYSKGQYSTLFSELASGNATNAGQYSSTTDAYLKSALAVAGSKEEYQRIFSDVYNKSKLLANADPTLVYQNKSIDLLQQIANNTSLVSGGIGDQNGIGTPKRDQETVQTAMQVGTVTISDPLQVLSDQVKSAKEEAKAAQIANQQVQTQLLRLMKRWDGDGIPATRDV